MILFLFLACTADKPGETGSTTDGGSADGGSTDGGSADGGTTDGGSTDGGSTDGGSTDGGSTVDWTVHCSRGDAAIPSPGELQIWPDQGLGPYYRDDMPARTELNATGEDGPQLVIDGRLLDVDGAPFADTVVHLYHADQDGQYDTTSDDYQAQGAVTTDADGAFCAHSLVPPNYTDGGDGMLPQHLHMAVLIGKGLPGSPHAHIEGDVWLETYPQPPQTVIPLEDMGDGNHRLSFDVVLAAPPG